MLTLQLGSRGSRPCARRLYGAVLTFAGLVLALPAAAGTVYSWQADDGSTAYADEFEKVPSKYRERVQTRQSSALSSYARYTPQDGGATTRYANDLEARLDRFRNEKNDRTLAIASARSPQTRSAQLLSIGGANGATLQITPGLSDEPVIVETVFSRPNNKSVTRQIRVVKQGDRTLAIFKPRLREWNVSSDVIDEDEILP